MSEQVMVVTGGFGTVGAAVALAAGEAGWKVATVDRAPVPASASRKTDLLLPLGDVDLTNEAAAQRAIAAVIERFGRIDALANIAGGFKWQTVQDGDAAAWDWLYEINVKTCVLATRAALPHLVASGNGRIVNVGASAALKAVSGMGAYAASKSGVLRLTESLAEELKDRGVRVNAVLPSIIDTPPNRADMPQADTSRWVAPADLAAVVMFLASDASRAVTGASIPVLGRA